MTGVNRRLREAEKKIKNMTTAIEAGGGAIRSLLNRLEELETERIKLAGEQGQLEKKITASRIARPDTAQVQAHWNEFLTIWEVASDEEKAKLLPLIVERVEVTEKERGFCRLVFQPEIPRSRNFSTSGNVVVNSKMGAPTSGGATNRYCGFGFETPVHRPPWLRRGRRPSVTQTES